MGRSAVVATAVLALLLTGLASGSATAASPSPIVATQQPAALSGPTNWVILRCAYQALWPSGTSHKQPKSYFVTMFSAATPNLGSYWHAASYGKISVAATILGTETEWRPLPHPNSYYGATQTTQDSNLLSTDCAAAWENAVTFSTDTYYAFVLDQSTGADIGGRFTIASDSLTSVLGVEMVGGGQQDEALWAHEMGHAFGLQHSFGGDGQPYDTAYDIMSAPSGECPAHGGGSWWNGQGIDVRNIRTINFGCIPGQPLAYFKAKVLGWIPAARQYRPHGGTHTVTLERLANPVSKTNYLYAEIDVSSSVYYTVEARFETGISNALATGYDENIPGPVQYLNGQPQGGCVVINKITVDPNTGDTITLQGTDTNHDSWWDDPTNSGTNGGSCFQAGSTFSAMGGKVQVRVNTHKPSATSFSVSLTGPTANGYDYYPLTHTRILDTHSALGGHNGSLGAGHSLSLAVLGHGGIPASGIGAVVVNLWAVGPTAGSYLTVYPSGTARPGTANLQLVAHRTSSNLVTVKPGADGKIVIYNQAGSTHLMADVVGYYGSPYAGLRYTPINPETVYPTTGPCVFFCSILPNSSANLAIQGYGALPPSGVTAVALQVTSEFPSVGGKLFLYPKGATKPALNDIGYRAIDMHTWLVIVKVGSGGQITVNNTGSGTAQLLFKVEGWYGAVASSTFRPTVPARVVASANVLVASTLIKDLSGVGGVPASGAVAVLTNVSALPATNTSTSWMEVSPTGAIADTGSYDVSFQGSDANAVIAELGTGGNVNFHNETTISHFAIDTFGWFGAP